MFARNVGTIDRVARVGAGAALLLLAATGVIGLWGLVGLVPLATGLAGTCPVYSLLGLRSCPLRRAAS